MLYPNTSSLTTEKITQKILNHQELVSRMLTNEEIKNMYLDLVQKNTAGPWWEILE